MRHCTAHPLCSLLLQLRQEAQKRLSGEVGEGIGDYDYNNANDTANFCPALQVPPSPRPHWRRLVQ